MRVKSDSNSGDDAKWEGGDNHSFTAPSDGTSAVSVVVEWGGEIDTEAVSLGAVPTQSQQQQRQAQQQEEHGREERQQRETGKIAAHEAQSAPGRQAS